MRYHLATAALMSVGLVTFALNAFADDPYYGDGTSRWEHASDLGSLPIVVGGVVVAALVTLWVLARGLKRRPISVRQLIAFALLYVFALYLAWLLMSVGH